MKIGKRSLMLIPALACALLAISVNAAAPASSEGLVQVKTKTLSEFYLRPQAGLANYRQVMIDPAHAEFQKGWLKGINSTRDVTRWLSPDDAKTITDDMAASLGKTVAAEFAARGYQIVAAPGPGVLRLSPAVTDLFVNAPNGYFPGIQRQFVYQEGGTATLQLEARDAVTGTLVALVVDRDTAREVKRINETTSVQNNFWFDAMFRQWAANCVKEFEAAKTLP
jgi:uncharacterized protein DUF3313